MTLTPLDPDVVAADLRPPPLADLARRARRRTRRRRITGAAAVTATLAAAVALTGPFWPEEPRPPAATASPQASTVPTESTKYVSPDLVGPVERHLLTVPLDRVTAVAVEQTGCRITIRLTTDAGRTWTRPGGPPTRLSQCEQVDDLQISYTILDTRSYRFTIAGLSWFTTDAGRTWTEPPPDRVVDAFGPGQPGTYMNCVNGCDRPRAVDPGTGGLLTLRNGPPFDRLTHAVWAADPNTLWAVSEPAGSGPARASHSDDSGRTWSAPRDLPATGGVDLVAVDSRRAYVSVFTSEPRFAVYRTDDGGATWTELDPPSPFSRVTVTATGLLLVSDMSPTRTSRIVWTSADGGTTFAGPMSQDAPAPSSAGFFAGMVTATGDDRVLHVNDGTGWYAIQPPR